MGQYDAEIIFPGMPKEVEPDLKPAHSYTDKQLKYMREKLAENEAESMSIATIYELLMEGWGGYATLNEYDLLDCFHNTFPDFNWDDWTEDD